MMRLALVGGEEFADGFEDVHAELLKSVGDHSRGVYLPCAAAEDGPEVVEYWCNLAIRRLSATGAQVAAPRITDKASANDRQNVKLLAEADWIYLGGGKPHVALGTLSGTRVLDELTAAAQRGVLIIGASAGAMMMCTRSFVLTQKAMDEFERAMTKDSNAPFPSLPPLDCLNFVPNSICIPHFDQSYMRSWDDPRLLPAGFTLIGVDEQTALVNLASVTGTWTVSGRGSVTILHSQGAPVKYHAGQQITL